MPNKTLDERLEPNKLKKGEKYCDMCTQEGGENIVKGDTCHRHFNVDAEFRAMAVKIHGILYEFRDGDLPDTQSALRKIEEVIKPLLHEVLERQRVELVKKIEGRMPNEFEVRKYKTREARTWDEKNLVIEALSDVLALLRK